MFNLFKKDKGADLMAFLKEGMPQKGEGPGARLGREAPVAEEIGIQVEESGGSLPQELEEAAVFYANGKVGDAATVLNRYLLDHPDLHDPQPWYMLFDLYEASDQMEHFEDAAVDFAVRFERSPPTWAPRAQLGNVGKSATPQMSFGTTWGPADRARLQRFTQDIALQNLARIDLSRTPMPDADYIRVILDCLVSLQEKGKCIKLINAANLVDKLLHNRDQGSLPEPGWLLLLTLLQLSGHQAQFDDLAVDYAVQFEVSPPSYTPPRCLPDAHASLPHGECPSGLTFPLSGVVGGPGDAQLLELREFAEGKPQVEIDLARVTRIDFASIGLLLDTLISIGEGNRKLLFKEGNELVNVLLNIVGAGQFAAILGRTRV